MDLKEGLLAIKDMCEDRERCDKCSLNNKFCCDIPVAWSYKTIDKVVKEAEEWEKKKLKTLREVLIERFPYAPVWEDDNIPKKCPRVYFGENFVAACTGTTEKSNPYNPMCHDCWNKIAPYKYQGG